MRAMSLRDSMPQEPRKPLVACVRGKRMTSDELMARYGAQRWQHREPRWAAMIGVERPRWTEADELAAAMLERKRVNVLH